MLESKHDIELADLLQTEFDLYHLVEDIGNDELELDHLLKAWPLKSRKAIKIFIACQLSA